MADAELFERHLTDEQMQEIAAEEYRSFCRSYFERLGGTAIGNVAYPIVREMVAEVLGDSADELIRDKALEIVEGLTAYTVFHEPNAWDRTPSPAWSLLMQAVKDNEDAVRRVVQHHIHNLSKQDAFEIIKGSKLTVEVSA